MRSPLSICTFLQSDALAQSIRQSLSGDRYLVTALTSEPEFFQFLKQEKQQVDCLILQDSPNLSNFFERLHQQCTLLPLVIVAVHAEAGASDALEMGDRYHSPIYSNAAVKLTVAQIEQIPQAIEQAIAAFLQVSTVNDLLSHHPPTNSLQELTNENSLKLQQRRLAEKLKERLGYLGVYYKRDPKNFFRHLPPDQKQEFIQNLKVDYREIILNYFSSDYALNQKIDEFVNTAFFTDISVSQIVEIHMELMDDFSKQLKLEGRSEEILLDYRLTLIDVIAHLCEMYRRSIPREA